MSLLSTPEGAASLRNGGLAVAVSDTAFLVKDYISRKASLTNDEKPTVYIEKPAVHHGAMVQAGFCAGRYLNTRRL